MKPACRARCGTEPSPFAHSAEAKLAGSGMAWNDYGHVLNVTSDCFIRSAKECLRQQAARLHSDLLFGRNRVCLRVCVCRSLVIKRKLLTCSTKSLLLSALVLVVVTVANLSHELRLMQGGCYY